MKRRRKDQEEEVFYIEVRENMMSDRIHIFIPPRLWGDAQLPEALEKAVNKVFFKKEKLPGSDQSHLDS